MIISNQTPVLVRFQYWVGGGNPKNNIKTSKLKQTKNE